MHSIDTSTYSITLGQELDALIGEIAHLGVAGDRTARHAVLRAAVLRGLEALARETRDAARSAVAERAILTLDGELAPSRRAAAAEWRSRLDQLTATIAGARMAFDQEGRPAGELVPGVIGEALMRGLEILAFEHGLARAGEPVFTSPALVPRDELETAESARRASEAALAHARGEPDALAQLARAFPSLRRGAPPGLVPWEPRALDDWAASDHRTATERHAMSFVLWVSDPDATRAVPFSLARALQHWDRPHRAVFTVWSSAPWWP